MLNAAFLNTIHHGLYDGNYSTWYNCPYSFIPGKGDDDSHIKFYNHYTGGHYIKWEFEDDGVPGFEFNSNKGEIVEVGGDYCWTNSGKNYMPFNNVLTGPHSAQEKFYLRITPPYQNDTLKYAFRIRYRIDSVYTLSNDTLNLMKINFLYGYHNTSNVYTIDTLRAPFYITNEKEDEGFNVYNDGITYTFNQQQQGIITDPDLLSGLTESTQNDTCPDCGMFLEFDYLADSGARFDIYLDYFETFCSGIGSILIDTSQSTNIKQNIQNSIELYPLGSTEIMNWRGYMEPVHLDLFEPFRITREYMEEITSSNNAILTQVYNPLWRSVNGENRNHRLYRYLDTAEPKVLTLNRYPITVDADTEDESCKKIQVYNDIMMIAGEECHDREIKLISVVQAHRFDSLGLRQPTPAELEAMVNVSLANGAKSILYFKWTGSDQGEGILTATGDTTDIYTHLRSKIGPKLNNSGGATNFSRALMNIEFQDNYIDCWSWNAADPCSISADRQKIVDCLDWVDVDTSGCEKTATFIREFVDQGLEPQNPVDIHYLYIVNRRVQYGAGTAENSYLKFKFGSPYSYYTNIRIVGLEDEIDTCYSTCGLPFEMTKRFASGEGRLWKFYPVVSSGGAIYCNELFTENIVLGNKLSIKNGAELSISGEYTLEADIKIDSAASIVVQNGGDIVLDGGNLYFSSWDSSLVIMEYDNHPKLVWGVNTWIDSLQNYKIYRKNSAGRWNFLAQADSNYYIDEYYTIYGGIGDSILVQYKVTAYGEINGRPGESGYTNTVEKFVNTGEANKRNSGNHRLPTVFDLRNNYPNPFNPETRIKFQLPENADISLIIYDILGSRVEVLHDGPMNAGYYEKIFRPEGLASGVYICRMQAPKFNKSIKLIYIK